ncbi:PREDICTED: uncharacterized protein LOC106810312 [Priapulus caudatus]|uniref:Uncharacterized protein LOC106810312 n=1 Tax=Priapulus caudatus TaxID=37621 RepID=A0ABM1EA85_PRICU|nr:PREDICTED: uncharacterized protein LOC106810312 [Priapulus caudatus]
MKDDSDHSTNWLLDCINKVITSQPPYEIAVWKHDVEEGHKLSRQYDWDEVPSENPNIHYHIIFGGKLTSQLRDCNKWKTLRTQLKMITTSFKSMLLYQPRAMVCYCKLPGKELIMLTPVKGILSEMIDSIKQEEVKEMNQKKFVERKSKEMIRARGESTANMYVQALIKIINKNNYGTSEEVLDFLGTHYKENINKELLSPYDISLKNLYTDTMRREKMIQSAINLTNVGNRNKSMWNLISEWKPLTTYWSPYFSRGWKIRTKSRNS